MIIMRHLKCVLSSNDVTRGVVETSEVGATSWCSESLFFEQSISISMSKLLPHSSFSSILQFKLKILLEK